VLSHHILYIIVLEALSRKCRRGLPLEVLYADDLVLIADTEEQILEKTKKWHEREKYLYGKDKSYEV